jgi:predicted Zn-dependent protease
MTEVERRNVSAHNDFLDRAAQMGLIGVAVYLWLLVIAARVLRRALKAFDQNHRGDVAALGASLVAYLFAIQFGFSSVAPMALWWLLLGCLAGIGMRNAEFRNPNSNPPPAPPPTPAPPEEGRGVKGTRLAKQNVILISLTLVWVTLTGWTLFWFIADVHFQRGEIAWKMGDKSAAVTELERAVAWRPGHDFYLARLGQLQEEQRNDGTDYYHAAVRANPVNAANHALLATALQTAGQDKAALEEWRTTVALDPQWAQAHNALGMLYHKLADDSSAIEAYHRAIEIEPEYAAAYNNLGNAYLSDGKIEQALACYQRALSL